MASEEHLRLANEIKSLHRTLREKTKKLGKQQAWKDHLQSKIKLQSYAQAMKELAVNHWEYNNQKKTIKLQQKQRSRIEWSVNYCRDYFKNDSMITHLRQRELRIMDELKIDSTEMDQLNSLKTLSMEKIKLLDVGSCYNPFEKYSEFEVTAIDIAPAIDTVRECDFLNVELADDATTFNESESKCISKLPINSFDVVVFSLLLEYLPTSEQRLNCCQKAYQLLRSEGILIIITPDSKHCGANAKLMKTWRYALALIGFNRIKYEKLEHITCMVFRKCLDSRISHRWTRIHMEPYMTFSIEIPQDSDGADPDISLNRSISQT